MPQYNTSPETMTPGSAVADGLQEILANRRAQAQQDLVDKLIQDKFGLDQQNVQSEIASRADNNATNKTIRDANAAASAQTVADKQAKQDRFKASSDYLTNTYFNSPEFAALPPESKLVWQLAAKDPDQLEKAIAMKMTPQAKADEYEPENWFDDVTKKTGQVLGPDGKPHLVKKGSASHYITRPQETAPPLPQQRIKSVGVDQDNNEIFSYGEKDPKTNIPILYKSDPNGAGLLPYTGVVKPSGGAQTSGPGMIPTGEATRLWGLRMGTPARGNNPAIPGAMPTKARSLLDPSSWLNGADAPPDPTGLATWQNAAISSVSNLKKVPSAVLTAFTNIVKSPPANFAGHTAQDIVNSSEFSGLQPPEKTLLLQYLQGVGIN